MTISAITLMVREIVSDNNSLPNYDSAERDSIRGLISGLCTELVWGLKLLSSILKRIQNEDNHSDKVHCLREIKPYAIDSFSEFEINKRVNRLYRKFFPSFPIFVLDSEVDIIPSPKKFARYLRDIDYLFTETMEEDLTKLNTLVQSPTATDDDINDAIRSTLVIFERHIRKLKASERSIQNCLPK